MPPLDEPCAQSNSNDGHFDFVEIGTSDFDTEIQQSVAGERGLSVEPLQFYLDRLPDKRGVTKVCAAISRAQTDEQLLLDGEGRGGDEEVDGERVGQGNGEGRVTVHFVHPDDLARHPVIPRWVRGCNSVGEPHPQALDELRKHGLDGLLQSASVPLLTFGELCEAHNVRTVDLLKIDVEGHDTVVLHSLVDYGMVWPRVIQFETNGLCAQEDVDSVIRVLCDEHDYVVLRRDSSDTMLTRARFSPRPPVVAAGTGAISPNGPNAPFVVAPVVHVVAPPSTVVSSEHSICAFTQHARMLPLMLRPFGWRVIEYSNEGSTSEADEHVVILRDHERKRLSNRGSSQDATDCDNSNVALVTEFRTRVVRQALLRARPRDIFCHTYGAVAELTHALASCAHVESHVGYSSRDSLQFRVYASEAWRHWHAGARNELLGNAYEWVAPLAFDTYGDWPLASDTVESREGPVVTMGRVCVEKGMNVVLEVARRMSTTEFHVYGPGDTSIWPVDTVPPNVHFIGSVTGAERLRVFAEARCVLMPTQYIEPFGASGVEAQLCAGAPLIASSFGAFTETVEHGVNGYRCRTLEDWVCAIERCGALDRALIARRARKRYSTATVGRELDMAFRQIGDRFDRGWYSNTSHLFSDLAI